MTTAGKNLKNDQKQLIFWVQQWKSVLSENQYKYSKKKRQIYDVCSFVAKT